MDDIISRFDNLSKSLSSEQFLHAQHTPLGNVLMRVWNLYNVQPLSTSYYTAGIAFLEYAHVLPGRGEDSISFIGTHLMESGNVA